MRDRDDGPAGSGLAAGRCGSGDAGRTIPVGSTTGPRPEGGVGPNRPTLPALGASSGRSCKPRIRNEGRSRTRLLPRPSFLLVPTAVRRGFLILHLQFVDHLVDVGDGPGQLGYLSTLLLRIHFARERDHSGGDGVLDAIAHAVLDEGGLDIAADPVVQR